MGNGWKTFKEVFSEIFTLLAWITLLGYVFYCTVQAIKTDSVRDAWNILILIAGFVWGKAHQRSQTPSTPEGTTKTELNLTATTVTEEPKSKENEK